MFENLIHYLHDRWRAYLFRRAVRRFRDAMQFADQSAARTQARLKELARRERARRVACPLCLAPIGVPCVDSTDGCGFFTLAHAERVRLAEQSGNLSPYRG